jgi:hypothetical protein
LEALCYKPESRDEVNEFFLILSAALGPGVNSPSNRYEYQKQKNSVSHEKSMAGA